MSTSVVEILRKYLEENFRSQAGDEGVSVLFYYILKWGDEQEIAEGDTLVPGLIYRAIVEDDMEGEGGPEAQGYVLHLEYEGEDRYVRVPVSWVSWDGYYSEVDDIFEVFPMQVMTTVYRTTK